MGHGLTRIREEHGHDARGYENAGAGLNRIDAFRFFVEKTGKLGYVGGVFRVL
jgi:hypothetical protein